MGKFDNYLFRCSSLGKIISKKGDFTQGIKTYLKELFIEETYGVRKEAYGIALDKGIFCEEDGITLLQNTLLKGKLAVKNKDRKLNEFIIGECDICIDGTVYDIKNAQDILTFGSANVTWEYEWQLVGYAWLWDVEKAILFYCLHNMPESLLDEEKMKMFYKNRWKFSNIESPAFEEHCNKLEKLHNYDYLSIYERFKHWQIEVSEERIDLLKKAVIRARDYLNELQSDHEQMLELNKKAMGL